MPSAPPVADRVTGSLLGGALGDALGAPVEFLSLWEIRERYGREGIADLDVAYGRVGAITDDTQMALFTAEGLLRAHNRWRSRGLASVPSVVHHAYLRWLLTQGDARPGRERFGADGADGIVWPDGWLVGLNALHSARSPGGTCVSALQSGAIGTIEQPLNDSKGCGAVMRAAPVGLIGLDDPFQLGCEIGALTHGHPSGFLAAGFLASLIDSIAEGRSLEDAFNLARDQLQARPYSDECTEAVVHASSLAKRGGAPSAETVESLGRGWVSEEALAIALYCAFVADDFEEGVTLAVNHSGDSDSTGAIAGNILGCLLGRGSLPRRWLGRLELAAEIELVAADLARHRALTTTHERDDDSSDEDRYPGW